MDKYRGARSIENACVSVSLSKACLDFNVEKLDTVAFNAAFNAVRISTTWTRSQSFSEAGLHFDRNAFG